MIIKKEIDINNDGKLDVIYVTKNNELYNTPYGVSDKPYYFTSEESAKIYDILPSDRIGCSIFTRKEFTEADIALISQVLFTIYVVFASYIMITKLSLNDSIGILLFGGFCVLTPFHLKTTRTGEGFNS